MKKRKKACEAKVDFMFQGTAYKTPLTIMQLLEDEGLTIPEKALSFEFECIFSSTNRLESPNELTWNTKHIHVSVSLCCDEPENDQPKCFVTNGNSNQLVKELVDYLVEISRKSYGLLKEEVNSFKK